MHQWVGRKEEKQLSEASCHKNTKLAESNRKYNYLYLVVAKHFVFAFYKFHSFFIRKISQDFFFNICKTCLNFVFLNWLSLNEWRDVELVILVKTYLLKVLLKEAFKSKLMDSWNSLRRILGGQTSLNIVLKKIIFLA